MRYRKSTFGSTRLVSLRIEEETLNNLRRYNINLNAQVNHYLNQLSMNLDLYDGVNSFFVYTK